MLAGITNPVATPERVAWMTMWARCFASLQATLGAVAYNSEFAVALISRSTFDAMAQTYVISDSSIAFDPVNRLKAYMAWCLWNDIQYYGELGSNRTMHGLWNPQPALEILDDADQLRFFLAQGGEMSDLHQAASTEGREEMQDSINRRCNCLESLFDDPSLRIWREKIEKLRDNKVFPISFFQLFDNDTNSISKQLRKIGIRFAYSSYMQDSMILHGSSVEAWFMTIGDEENILAPKCIPLQRGVPVKVDEILGAVRYMLTILGVLQPRIWRGQ